MGKRQIKNVDHDLVDHVRISPQMAFLFVNVVHKSEFPSFCPWEISSFAFRLRNLVNNLLHDVLIVSNDGSMSSERIRSVFDSHLF